MVLSTVPCCTAKHEAVEKYCNENQTDTSSHQQDDDCASNCSPFYSCGTCVGFTFTSSCQLVKPTVLSPGTSKLIPYNQPFSLGYFGKVWQPPKTA